MNDALRRGRTRDLLLLGAAWFAPPLLCRIAALLLLGRPPVQVDGYGLGSDLGVSLLLLALFGSGSWLGLALTRIVAPLSALLSYANLEHVLVHDASIDFYYLTNALDPTFVKGSMALPRQPWLLFACVAAASGPWFVRSVPKGGGRLLEARTRALSALAALALLAASSLSYPDFQQAPWRQRNVLHRGLVELPALLREQRAFTDLDDVRIGFPAPSTAPSGMEPWRALLQPASLGGELRFQPTVARPNVVVLLLESLSATHFPSLAPPHARSELYSLPRSDALLAGSLRFDDFMALQRTTNRGEYCLLCGDHPNLSLHVAKMDAAAYDGMDLRNCLPWRLREQGYRTMYLQSAPLPYMQKDRFMPLAGFEQLQGFESFPPESIASAWGPDDRTLLNRVSEQIEAARGQKRPLFLTVLSVGTHHPYAVPRSFRGRHPPGTFEAAVEFLDMALAEFLERLQASGALNDTYVFVTADESIGYERGTATQQHYAQNWTPMFLLGPGVPSGTVSESFNQGDLALSVLDLVGARQGELPPGRSLLRLYAQPRMTAFGNTRYRDVSVRFDDGLLMTCDALLEKCTALEPFEPRLVASSYRDVAVPEGAPDRLRQFLHWNERGYPDHMPNPEVRLTPTERIQVPAGGKVQLMGQQRLTFGSDTQLQIQIELAATAGAVSAGTALRSGNVVHHRWPALEIPAQRTGQLWLDYHCHGGLRDAEVVLTLEALDGQPARVDVVKATLRQRSAGRTTHGVLASWARLEPER